MCLCQRINLSTVNTDLNPTFHYSLNTYLCGLFPPQRCFTFMDRGFVFKQINNYISCFAPGDPKVVCVPACACVCVTHFFLSL